MDATRILAQFAASTGLTAAVQPRRYLWTDAFAVMTWVGLGELELARRLIEQVHAVLGAEKGVRIGKPLPERAPHEPYDPELEWERDGQYYHYLTKWMQALERTARATGDERYHRSAVELARTANHAFIHPGGMYWKMSVDLSRPLVPSMGAHDPLDGLITTVCLGLPAPDELERLCERMRWASADALGAGGLLIDALRLARLEKFPDLLAAVLADAETSVQAAARSLRGPASQRLAFRELGFALGLHAIEPLGEYADTARLRPFVPLARELKEFWLHPASQAAPTWTGHHDINAVTLAACLAPVGVLGQAPSSRASPVYPSSGHVDC
jgi:hypothetical protein